MIDHIGGDLLGVHPRQEGGDREADPSRQVVEDEALIEDPEDGVGLIGGLGPIDPLGDEVVGEVADPSPEEGLPSELRGAYLGGDGGPEEVEEVAPGPDLAGDGMPLPAGAVDDGGGE